MFHVSSIISADLLRPNPREKNGNHYLLVVVDWFTKSVLVHRMPIATTKPYCEVDWESGFPCLWCSSTILL